jgi:PPE-repeat protein
MKDEKGNSGDWNSGDWNSGNWNSGNWNSGNSNSGYRNSGDRNSGNSNSGDWNSGYRNSGDRNSGYWNSGDRNSGFFNTDEPTVRMFNKDTGLKRDDITLPDFLYFKLTEWVEESDMSNQEKNDHKDFHVTGGYLKTMNYKDAFRAAWNNAGEDERQQVIDLPNFNADIFLEISGVDVRNTDTVSICIEGSKTVNISRESAKALGLLP